MTFNAIPRLPKCLAKILVKRVSNGLFLDRAGGWTATVNDAIQFTTTVAAYDHCSANRYMNVATIISFQNRRHEMEFPHPM